MNRPLFIPLLPIDPETGHFGKRAGVVGPVQADGSQFHSGVDFQASKAMEILCPEGGAAFGAMAASGGLMSVLISTCGRRRWLIGHCSAVLEGPREAGQPWCLSGDSGLNSTGPHAHLSVFEDGKLCDPVDVWRRCGVKRYQPRVFGEPVSWSCRRRR